VTWCRRCDKETNLLGLLNEQFVNEVLSGGRDVSKLVTIIVELCRRHSRQRLHITVTGERRQTRQAATTTNLFVHI